ncbi:PilW family protein [Bacteroidota bacterium]
MGSSTLLDILGSMVIGGMLLLIIFRMHDANVENIYTNSAELIVQQDLTAIVELIEYDFRKIGYCKNYYKIPNPAAAIIHADTSRISFLTDVAEPPTYPQGDGIIDTLSYYLGPTSELSITPNPDDKLLYRVLNNDTPAGSNLGVTFFYIIYFNALGAILPTPVQNPGEIARMEIAVQVENVAAYDEKYSTIFWRQIRLVARNLNNR